MKKLSIQLTEGRKTIEKVEISNHKDLESLYESLKATLFNQNPKSEDTKEPIYNEREIYHIRNAMRVPENAVTIPCGKEPTADVKAIENVKSAYAVPESGIKVSCTNETLEDLKTLAKHEAEFESIKIDSKPEYVKSNDAISAFFIMKCPRCGRIKCFNSNTDKLYHCECDATFSTSKFVKIYGKCPNCANNIGIREYSDKIVATLEGMDISEGMRCSKCKSPVDFKYNEAKHRWEALE